MGEKNENSSEKFYHDSEAFWSFFCICLVFLVLKSLLGIARQICNFDPKASESC